MFTENQEKFVSSSCIEIEITQRESKLILEFGYPFPEQETLFIMAAKKKGSSVIQIDDFWLETIIGDLSRSLKAINNSELREEIDILCDFLELSLKAMTVICSQSHNQKMERDILDAASIQNHECCSRLSFLNICSGSPKHPSFIR